MSPSIMDHHHQQSMTLTLPNHQKAYRLTNGHSHGNGTVNGNGNGAGPRSPPSIWFEIRLFYVRIAPCAIETLPEFLTLRHLRESIGVSLEINGTRVPASDTATSTLRRDRVDRDAAEVTYVSTDTVRITGGVEFEVYEKESLVLCGNLEKLEDDWSMDCYTASYCGGGGSGGGGCGGGAFFQPKLGISSPSIEVYVAGRWADVPVILTKMINLSPRRKGPRCSTLDSIPEVDDESDKVGSGLIRHRKLQLSQSEDEYETEGKMVQRWYPDEVYEGEDGQLTWFNAGVRVGVGIGLGMCLGIGIGVGLLMRSYQTTTRNFRRKFF